MRPENSVRLAASAGFSRIDLIGAKPELIPVYQRALERWGVRVCCFACCLPFFGEPAALADALESALDSAEAVKACLFMIIPYNPVIDAVSVAQLGPEGVRTRLLDGFRTAVAAAQRRGMTACFETTPYDVCRLSGTEDCLWVLERVPGLGLVLDSANMLPHGDSTMDAYRRLKSFIVHVHLKDVTLTDASTLPPSVYPYETAADGRVMRLAPPGEGDIPVRELYDTMLRDGYAGTFAVEYAPPQDAPGDFSRNLLQLSRAMRALAGAPQRPIGVNSYGVAPRLYENAPAALAALHDFGFTRFEPCLVSDDAAPNLDAMDPAAARKFREMGAGIWTMSEAETRLPAVLAAGLKVVSAHFMVRKSAVPPQALAGYADELIRFGVSHGLRYYVISLMVDGNGAAAYAPALEQLARSLADAGITLCYHNHEQECAGPSGETSLDFLMRSCPSLYLEPDVGWILFSGADPIRVMRKYADRIRLLHLKDIRADASPETRSTCHTAVGDGALPLADVLAAAGSCALDFDGIILDQDSSGGDILLDLRRGLCNVRSAAPEAQTSQNN